jgi:hypothetical protein
VHIARSCVCVALAYLWSSTATAIAPATPQQMVCVPAVFVVATVTNESPSVSIPEHCKESHHSFCVFRWLLTLKVDQVIAAGSSDFSPEETSGFQNGSILHVNLRVRASEYSKGVAPEDWQGDLSSPFLSTDELTSLLRNKQFIFGLLDFGDRTSQIWSMSFQGALETTLIGSATSGLESQRQCPRLMN